MMKWKVKIDDEYVSNLVRDLPASLSFCALDMKEIFTDKRSKILDLRGFNR